MSSDNNHQKLINTILDYLDSVKAIDNDIERSEIEVMNLFNWNFIMEVIELIENGQKYFFDIKTSNTTVYKRNEALPSLAVINSNYSKLYSVVSAVAQLIEKEGLIKNDARRL